MMGFRGVLLAAAVAVVFAGGSAVWFSNVHEQSVKLAADMERTFLRLERAIGYVGFIHQFKNYILRPEEPVYAERARESYRKAKDELAYLTTLLERSLLEVDIAPLEETLDRYNGMLDVARDAHARGDPVSEVDRLVRIPDSEAALNLSEFQQKLGVALDARRAANLLRLNTSLVLGAILFVGLLMTGAYAVRQRQFSFEQQERELEREQAHAKELGKLVHELERSNRELDEFAYTASHDLKEPLRGIAINANLLSREETSAKGRERIDRMVVLTQRMEQLISDLLYFSRLGRGEKVMKDVDPGHIIDGTRKELAEWLEDKGGEIIVNGTLPWLRAERSKVKTVFQNLIVNGLKYNDADKKTVEIGFLPQADVNGTTMRDVFYVRDNGIGIDEAHREKVFRIFSRLNPESAYGPGTGAGLSFVRKIIEEYGGEVTFVSQPKGGTTFYFSLPSFKKIN